MIDPRKVLRIFSNNSDIETFITKQFKSETLGELYETSAFVSNWIDPNINSMYGNASGAGTSRNRIVSALKAASEAVERTVFEQLLGSKKYALDIVPTTHGFAAYPGFTTKEARNNSFCEAIERWSVIKWWEGHLNSSIEPVNNHICIIWIENPFCMPVAVAANYVDANISQYSYGFGASSNRKQSIFKALVEYDRNERALKEHSPPKSLNDKRLRYFSTKSGHQNFWEKSFLRKKVITVKPEILIDSEIKSEFKDFCIWRTVFKYDNYEFLDKSNATYFYF